MKCTLCSYSFCLFSLISLSFSLSAERFALAYSFCLFSLLCLSILLSPTLHLVSFFLCIMCISLSVSLSAERFCLLHSFTCSCLCSAVLGVLCKNGNFFWMPSIKSLGNFLILLLKDFNIFFSSSVLNFGVLSSISFFL